MGAVSQHYRSFHVPKPEKSEARKTAEKLSSILGSSNAHSSLKSHFSHSKIEQIGKSGAVWIFSGNGTHSLGTTLLGKNPSLQHERGLFVFADSNPLHGSVSLDGRHERAIDLFLIGNPAIKTLNFVSIGKEKTSRGEIRFLDGLKKKYEGFGISVEGIFDLKALQKSIDINAHQKERTRGKGGMSIDL